MDKVNLKRWIKCYRKLIVLLILGFISLIISLKAEDKSILAIYTGTLSSYLILGAIFDILSKAVREESLLISLSKGINTEVNALKLGVEEIDLDNKKYLSTEKIIKSAKNNIDIFNIYGFTFARDNETEFINAINRGVKVRVVLADFENDINMKFYKNHMRNRDVASKVKEVLNLWQEVIGKSNNPELLEVYLYDGSFTHALHINEEYIILNSISSCKDYQSGVHAAICAKKIDGGVYEQFRDEFEEIINESRRYYFS